MVKSERRSASRLQMTLGMKSRSVVFLAVAVLSGCGIGADEYWDGEKLVSSNGEALMYEPGCGNSPPKPSGQNVTGTGGARDNGAVALPQDPIPVRPNMVPVVTAEGVVFIDASRAAAY